jgi:hypothetical protein
MQVRLPRLTLLVELTMDSAYYDCAGRFGTDELMAHPVNE